MKKISLVTECHRRFTIEAREVAINRANYYDREDVDATFEGEFNYTMENEDEITDWLVNNMNWYECTTLLELERPPVDLSDLEIDDTCVFEDSTGNIRSSSES